MVESALPRFILRVQPVGADDGKKHLTRRHLIVQACLKVNADDIHKEIFRPEYLRQPVMQLAGGADRIFSAVIDENLTRHGPVELPENRNLLSQNRLVGYGSRDNLPFRGSKRLPS